MKTQIIRRLLTTSALLLLASPSIGFAQSKAITVTVRSQDICGEESVCVKTEKGVYRANLFALSDVEKKLLEQAAKAKDTVCLKEVSKNSGFNFFEHVAKECPVDKSGPTNDAKPAKNMKTSTGKLDETCHFVFNFYYLQFDQTAKSKDPFIKQIQCLTGAQNIAKEEVISFDVQTLLGQAKVEPDDYRKVLTNAIQFACVRNSTGTKGMSYDMFKRTQCEDLKAVAKK
jgi:hypothetical protein